MSEDASVNTDAVRWPDVDSAYLAVRRMQIKLHRWAGSNASRRFVDLVGEVERRIGAQSLRIGVEAAGHYHRSVATTLARKGFDVVELNPFQVKTARVQLGHARVKTDQRDCLAMVELLVRGQDWPLHRHDGPVAEQAVWVAHRRRKLDAAQVLGSQIHALADLEFPGLTGRFKTGLESKTLRMLLGTLPDPARVAAMGPADLVRRAADHGVRMLRPKVPRSSPRPSRRYASPTRNGRPPPTCWPRKWPRLTPSNASSPPATNVGPRCYPRPRPGFS